MKEQHIERIPIAQIHIANPRPRSRGRWQMIVANIREVGLKKPITVVRRKEPDAGGQAIRTRLRSRKDRGIRRSWRNDHTSIITEASREDQFLMSLVENIARRPPSNRDIIREVRSLRERAIQRCGYCQKARHGTYVHFWHCALGRTQGSCAHRSRRGGKAANQRRRTNCDRKGCGDFPGSF